MRALERALLFVAAAVVVTVQFIGLDSQRETRLLVTHSVIERLKMFTYSAVVESLDHVFVTVTVSNVDQNVAWDEFRRECNRVKTSNVLP